MMIKKAFTLAEVLITLTIIGIVAAIVVPSLMSDINDKVWVSKRAALYARMSNALANMEKLNGYGEYTQTTDGEGNITVTDTASESFIIDGLSKNYKIKRVCGPNEYSKCGPKYTFANAKNTTMGFPASMKDLSSAFNDMKPTSFETNNGELIVAYYNPNCTYTRPDATSMPVTRAMCVNFIYDLNGPKNPNQVGKDIGIITAFAGLSNSPEVAMPIPIQSYKFNYSLFDGYGNGNTLDYTSALSKCEDFGEDYTLPNIYELASMALNSSLINNFTSGNFRFPEINMWSSTPYSAGVNGKVWIYASNTISTADKTSKRLFYCTQKQ